MQKLDEFNNILNIDYLAMHIYQLKHNVDQIKSITPTRISKDRRVLPAEIYKDSTQQLKSSKISNQKIPEENKEAFYYVEPNKLKVSMNIDEEDLLI